MSRTPIDDPGLDVSFAALRPRLRAIAYRMLGSHCDAEDAVQEAWLRLQRADADQDREPRGLADRGDLPGQHRPAARRRGPARGHRRPTLPDYDAGLAPTGPEDDAVHAEELGLAMMIVLDTLGPLERLAFVLHDMFGLPFDEVAPIIERTPTAARQLASRARRRIREVDLAAERDRRHAGRRAPSSRPRGAAISATCCNCWIPRSSCAPTPR